MDTAISRAVLITGCSSGIGRATALRLARSGWPVYATARHAEAIEDLAAACTVLSLDVTDEASMQAAVVAVVLVNNAGYSQSGAFETVPPELVRRQFETNLFGPVRLTQLVLPRMRQQGWGWPQSHATATAGQPSGGAPGSLAWLELVPDKVVAWDYGTLREVGDDDA